MSKTAILPEDIKQECIWIVHGYKRRVAAYLEARRDVIDGTECKYETVKDQRTGKYVRMRMKEQNTHTLSQRRIIIWVLSVGS